MQGEGLHAYSKISFFFVWFSYSFFILCWSFFIRLVYQIMMIQRRRWRWRINIHFVEFSVCDCHYVCHRLLWSTACTIVHKHCLSMISFAWFDFVESHLSQLFWVPFCANTYETLIICTFHLKMFKHTEQYHMKHILFWWALSAVIWFGQNAPTTVNDDATTKMYVYRKIIQIKRILMV